MQVEWRETESVCVFRRVKDQRECRNKYEKGKGKEGERRLSVVSNEQPLGIMQR